MVPVTVKAQRASSDREHLIHIVHSKSPNQHDFNNELNIQCTLHLTFGSFWNWDRRTKIDRSRRLLRVRRSYANQNSGQTPTWRPVNSFGIHSATRKKYRKSYWPFFWHSTVTPNKHISNAQNLPQPTHLTYHHHGTQGTAPLWPKKHMLIL